MATLVGIPSVFPTGQRQPLATTGGTQPMSVFMADRDLPGISLEQLAAAQQAAIDTSQRFTAESRRTT